ncbi:phosphopantetheine-binding protein [Cyanobium sp. ULC065]
MINSQTQVFSAFLSNSSHGVASLDSTETIYTQQQVVGLAAPSETITSAFAPPVQSISQPPSGTILQQPVQEPATVSPPSGNGDIGHALAATPTKAVQPPLNGLHVDTPPVPPSNGHGATTTEPKQVPSATDASSILLQLTSLLSEKSGYPVELLDPDQDLESDLGIDSIKRIEVMGGLLATLPNVSPEALQSIQTGTRDLRTLREVAGHIAAILDGSINTVVEAEATQPGK